MDEHPSIFWALTAVSSYNFLWTLKRKNFEHNKVKEKYGRNAKKGRNEKI